MGLKLRQESNGNIQGGGADLAQQGFIPEAALLPFCDGNENSWLT